MATLSCNTPVTLLTSRLRWFTRRLHRTVRNEQPSLILCCLSVNSPVNSGTEHAVHNVRGMHRPSKLSAMARRPTSEDRILEGTLAAISRYGVHKLSMVDVAAEAGISRGTLYRYFETKEA